MGLLFSQITRYHWLLILIVLNSILFGFSTSDQGQVARYYLEPIVLWILPMLSLALILRMKSPIFIRVMFVVLLVLFLGLAEYVGIRSREFQGVVLTVPRELLYSYSTIYLLVGPLHLILFLSVLLFSHSKRLQRYSVIPIAILLVVASWWFISGFADDRPFFITSKLPYIMLESLAFILAAGYVVKKWMPWKYAAVLSGFALLSAFLPSFLA